MRISYLAGQAKTPQVSLGGGQTRFRPITAIRISGPTGAWIVDAILDTGSDDTIFPEWVAAVIGIDLNLATEQDIHLAGRGKPIRCRYHTAKLRLTDGKQETFEWDSVIGFVAIPLKFPLLGHAGGLQYFDANFAGANHTVDMVPNRSFSGQRI